MTKGAHRESDDEKEVANSIYLICGYFPPVKLNSVKSSDDLLH